MDHSFIIAAAGGEFLRRSLTQQQDPRKAIADFQAAHGLPFPSVRPVLQLLDVLEVPRVDVHRAVTVQLTEHLLGTLSSLTESQLEKLLLSSFPYIDFAELKAIPMRVMELIAVIPQDCIEALAATPAVLADCSIRVQQRVWTSAPELLYSSMAATADAYVRQYLDLLPLRSLLLDGPLLMTALRHRRTSCHAFHTLRLQLGGSVRLLNVMLSAVRTLVTYASLGAAPAYGALRADLVLATQAGDVVAADATSVFISKLHGVLASLCLRSEGRVGVGEATALAATHEAAGAGTDAFSRSPAMMTSFATSLSSAVQESAAAASAGLGAAAAAAAAPPSRLLHTWDPESLLPTASAAEVNALQQLIGLFEAVPNDHGPYGDIGLALLDTPALAWLLRMFLAALGECVQSESLPAAHPLLPALATMLAAGLDAPGMVAHQAFGPPTEDHADALLRCFAPALAGLYLDQAMRMPPSSLSAVDPILISFASEHAIGRMLIHAYVLDRLAAGSPPPVISLCMAMVSALLPPDNSIESVSLLLGSMCGFWLSARGRKDKTLFPRVFSELYLPLAARSAQGHIEALTAVLAIAPALPPMTVSGCLNSLAERGVGGGEVYAQVLEASTWISEVGTPAAWALARSRAAPGAGAPPPS